MPIYAEVNLPRGPLRLDDYKPTFAEYLGAAWGDADSDNPGTITANMLEASELRYGFSVREMAEEGGLTGGLEELRHAEPRPAMPLDEQKAWIKSEGLEGKLSPGEHYTREELEFLARLKREEINRKLTRELAPDWMAPFGFAAGLGASFTDPVNLATSFVPVLPEARVMQLLARNAGSAWSRAGVRAAVGAAEGAAGAAMVEPMVMGGKTELQQEYGFADSLMNVVFGASMGAMMHPASGALGDWMRARKGQRRPWEYVPSSDLTERLRAENAQRIWQGMRESGSGNLTPEHAEAAAALWDATIRGYAFDTGELVDDVYARYRTEWRGGKMELAPVEGTDVLEHAMQRSTAYNKLNFIQDVRNGKIEYFVGKVEPTAIKEFLGLDSLAVNYPYNFVQHLDNRRTGQTEIIMNTADDILSKPDYIAHTGTSETGNDLYTAVKYNEDGTATAITFALSLSKKKGNRISPKTAIIADKNSVDNVIRQKERSSTHPNAGSAPSSLKPLNEDEVRVLEDLYSDSLHQADREDNPSVRALPEEDAIAAEGAPELRAGMDMPPEERQTSLAAETKDVAQENQIFLNDGLRSKIRKTPIIVVHGNELGVPEGANLKEYIAAAKKYHDELKKESENGKPVFQPQLREKAVRFSSKGWRKNVYSGANPEKWKLFPQLREIIEGSTLIESQELNKNRKDGFSRFHWVEADVELDGSLRRVGLMLAEDNDGNLFYNLNADVDAWTKKSDSSNLPANSKAGESEPLRQDTSASLASSISTDNDGVNLHILSKKVSADPPRARVFFDQEDAFAVVEFLQAADPSSAPHEMYHIFRRIMAELYDAPNASEASKQRYRKACEFVGAEPGKVWTRKQEEMFASAGERFLLEGVSPNPRMNDVMESFQQWISEVYGNAERSGLEISDGMRDVFGKMMGTAEDGDIAFRYTLGRLLDYRPEASIDTRLDTDIDARVELPAATAEDAAPEKLREAMPESTARVEEAFGAEWRGGKVELTPEEGTHVLEQAMYRSKAATLDDFVAQVHAMDTADKAFFHTHEITLNGDTMPVELGTDQVRHIERRHPEFTEWSKIPNVIETGTPFFLGYSRYTRSPAFAYVLNEGDTSLLVIGSPMKGNSKRNRPPRVTTLTAFRADTNAVAYWISRFNNVASPSGNSRTPSGARGSRASLPSRDAALSPQGDAVMAIVTALDRELNEIAVTPNSNMLLKTASSADLPRARVTFGEADA